MAGHSHHDETREDKEQVHAGYPIESECRQHVARSIFGFDNRKMRQDHKVRRKTARPLNCQQLRHLPGLLSGADLQQQTSGFNSGKV
jgi:hypothetical protein